MNITTKAEGRGGVVWQLWVYTVNLLASSNDDDDDHKDGDLMGQARLTSIVEEPARRLLILPLRRERRYQQTLQVSYLPHSSKPF